MTDIVPAAEQQPMLVSRQAATPSAVQPAHLGAFKPENQWRAEQMSKATDMLPRAYHNKPGACLLALDYAERNELPIFDVVANVAFVHGRPVLSARLQKRLAARHGYRTQKVAGDERSCTVAVFGPDGTKLGEATYTIELAHAHGLVSRSDIWKADPAQMLFHRATTRALDHYGPGELAMVFAEEPASSDTLDVLGAGASLEPPEAIEAPPEPEQAQEVTEDDLRAAGKVGEIIKAAKAHGLDVGLVSDVVADQAVARAVLGDLAK